MKSNGKLYNIAMIITHILPTVIAFVTVMFVAIIILLNEWNGNTIVGAVGLLAVFFYPVPGIIMFVYPITAIVCGIPALILDIKRIKVCKSNATVIILCYNAMRLFAATLAEVAVIDMLARGIPPE